MALARHLYHMCISSSSNSSSSSIIIYVFQMAPHFPSHSSNRSISFPLSYLCNSNYMQNLLLLSLPTSAPLPDLS